MFYLDLVHFKILFVQGIIFCQNLIVNLKLRSYLLPLLGESRISNISELSDFLLKENFEIINPENLNIEDLSNKIRNSEILISEKHLFIIITFYLEIDLFSLLSSKTK